MFLAKTLHVPARPNNICVLTVSVNYCLNGIQISPKAFCQDNVNPMKKCRTSSTLKMDHLLNLEFQSTFVIQHGIPILMLILGGLFRAIIHEWFVFTTS